MLILSTRAHRAALLVIISNQFCLVTPTCKRAVCTLRVHPPLEASHPKDITGSDITAQKLESTVLHVIPCNNP